MDEDVLICPECGAEYYAHVKTCKGCGVALVRPGRAGEAPSASGSLVCIEAGGYDRVSDMARSLKGAGFECGVLKTGGKSSCATGGEYGLFVDSAVASKAAMAIEDLWLKLHPEMKQTESRLLDGLCPACGARLQGAPSECPDCGLNLGGGGGGHGHGDGCGGCC
jgi:ribosomal protein L40E